MAIELHHTHYLVISTIKPHGHLLLANSTANERTNVIPQRRPDGASGRIHSVAMQREGRGLGTQREVSRQFMVGHLVNHPPAGERPNVAVAPLDLHDDDEPLWREIAAVNFRPSGAGEPRVRTAVLVASRDLCDEELYLDYKLQRQGPVESWYSPVHASDDSVDAALARMYLA